jgi:hypothetical protein
MAAWQVEFDIVPRREGGVLPAEYTRLLGTSAASGPEAASPHVQTWGEAEGNRVDVSYANGWVTRITAYVDVRRLDSKFSAMLLQFARVADAVFVRKDGLVVEPLVGAFGAALRGSKAWQFANDPAAHIAAYKEDDDE